MRKLPAGQMDRYYTGLAVDYVIAISIALPLSLLVAVLFINIIGLIGWFSWLLSLMAAPKVAELIVKAVRWGVQKRRSRYLAHVVSG